MDSALILEYLWVLIVLIAYLPKEFRKSVEWKITFWAFLLLIAILGWFLSKEKAVNENVSTK
jgi:hypothetical protein